MTLQAKVIQVDQTALGAFFVKLFVPADLAPQYLDLPIGHLVEVVFECFCEGEDCPVPGKVDEE